MVKGCCGACDGFGADASAPETGGLCWDCRGSGHPHTGPCTGWEAFAAWCHRHELDVLSLVMAWAWISTFVLIFLPPGGQQIGGLIVGGPVLLGLPAWVAMSKIGDRQMIRERERAGT